MVIACAKCHTQNSDAARFCRACGAPLGAGPTASDLAAVPTPTDIACEACGRMNRDSARFCAGCGANLLGAVIVPHPSTALPIPPTTPAPAPAPEPTGRPAQITVPASRFESPSRPAAPPPSVRASTSPTASRLTPALWSALGLLVLVAAGAGWWVVKQQIEGSPVPEAGASAPRSEPAAPAAPAASAATDAAMRAVVPEPIPQAPTEVAPAVAQPSTGTEASDASAAIQQRLEREAAAQRDRDKVTRERAERARVLAEQREQTAARLRADQEAARQRAKEDAARPSPVPMPVPAPVPAPEQAPARTVKEVCGGRNFISQALCESRECRKPQHVAEAHCKWLKQVDEERQQRQQ